MTSINTNTTATISSNALAKNDRAMSQSMERLSTGQRINSSADDAAGVAISSKMTSQIRGVDQATRNANDAISMVQTADGAAIEVTNMLQRMRELSVQAATGTNTSSDITSLNSEFEALRDQIGFVATNTQWNGKAILDGTAGEADGTSNKRVVNFQVGANNAQTIAIDFGDFNLAKGATGASAGVSKGALAADLSKLEVNTALVINTLDDAIAGVNAQRSSYGAMVNRLEYAVDNLSNVSQNAEASRSRILDSDYAAESTELARTQIIQQAGTAMLAQANQQAESVLALLK
jgi:flagellin